MDISGLFLACRLGDVSRVSSLITEKEVDPNVRDKWDSTPLYYACLCGHEEVVKCLLENGARCEANTFDGERCLYGALNNDIKAMLKSYKAITSVTIRRDVYVECLRRLYERGAFCDITFDIRGHRTSAHRFILYARSSYFANLLETRWRDKDIVTLPNTRINHHAFQALLLYLYTGSLAVPWDLVESVRVLAKQCRMEKLIEELDEKIKKVWSFVSTKPGVHVTTLSLEPSLSNLQNDLGMLADLALPQSCCTEAECELPFPTQQDQIFPDVIFSVRGHRFLCHKTFVCERSEYFKVQIEQDHFGETEVCCLNGVKLPVVSLTNLSVDVFIQVLYHIYQDSCQLTKQNVFDVLCAADMLLLIGLKRQCANVISQCLDDENVVTIVRTARLFNMPRLEDQCAEYIAEHIDKVVLLEEFAELVKDDAQQVKEREEADSIGIIDDVRFHITNFVQTYSDVDEANEKLACIDELLEQLGLEG